ncbi:AMP-binding protein [Gordonia sp. SID5947]|uniref:class I adenylate-forming enzyme family protein n=1 Tax=Gordonia sp. SID5947 TaxID=2690315 RepID=UPI00136F09F0|nr:class I adenylate-forming enzyme family protein [Gordonia sp. SID5947]MYR05541.1 AMP-binding protein [Gordonia sp. SID5947]
MASDDDLIRPTIAELLKRAAHKFADVDYTVSPTDRMTYAEAEERSALVARWLLTRPVGKGCRVGLFFTSGVEWTVWWLAVSRIGAVAVPLSTLYPPAELARVLRLADVELLVAPTGILGVDVPDKLEATLPGLDAQESGRVQLPAVPFLRDVVLTGRSDRSWATHWRHDDTSLVDKALLAAVENEVSPADIALMIHTSGSTAAPKGVVHTQGTLVRQTSQWVQMLHAGNGAAEIPVVLCAMPVFWIGGILAAAGALHAPATVLTVPRHDPGPALDLIEREQATGYVGWPAFVQQLRAHPSFGERDLSRAPILRDGPADLAMINSPHGHPIHRTMTETAGGWATTEKRIVDDGGEIVPVGEIGELWIRGTGVMSGYNKRERAEVFDADGWFHTGDQVYELPGDPRLFYVGRDSELIKAAGSNVSPREVEAVVEEFADVAHCLVVGIDHPTRGEEVVAVVVPAGTDLDAADLERRTREQLSRYKVPTTWFTATIDELPLFPTGKPDRRLLRARMTEGTLGVRL